MKSRVLGALQPIVRVLILLGLTALPAFASQAEEVSEGAGAEHASELPRIVNFTILAVILVLVLRKPLAGFLVAQTDQIREQLADAKTKQARADEERKRAEELLESLEDEVAKAKEEARKAAESERDRILRAAELEAARVRELARKEIDAEVESGRRRLLARATELSVDLAHKKLESSMTEADQKKLVERSIELLEKRA
jgi:F-type H+-transporting ATPase subunit b